MKFAAVLGLAATALLVGGCVYVPPTPTSPGYYAPVGGYVAPAPAYRPYYYRPYYYRPYYY